MAAAMMVAGCGSSYLAARKALITEKMGTGETGKTREELEKRWGKPVWERTYTRQSPACFKVEAFCNTETAAYVREEIILVAAELAATVHSKVSQ
jgi:hypothetical protein